jgi:hypothetical protein
VPRRRVLHGTLIGVVAVSITLGMTRDLSIPYVAAHLLKVLGGAAGGFAASRRSNATDVLEVQRV